MTDAIERESMSPDLRVAKVDQRIESSPIRIGFDARELAGGVRTGIGRYLFEIVRIASERRIACVLYAKPGARPDVSLPGVSVRTIRGRWTQWWDQVALPRAMARDHLDVFLSPYYKAPLFAPCPLVITVHDVFFIGYPGRWRPMRDRLMTRLARLYAWRARAIVTDSEHSRRAIVARLRLDRTKVHVIGVAVGAEFGPTGAADAVARRYGVDGPYVLYLGNFKPHKNLARLVEAYGELPDVLRRSHTLVLAGADMTNRSALEQFVVRHGLRRQVVFTGRIAPDDLPALYAGASAFVMPSLDEGFGLPAVEAMACAAPVVVSNSGALPEVVGEAALLVDACSVRTITAGLARVLGDRNFAAELGRRGLERAREFASDKTAGRVLALCEEVSRRSTGTTNTGRRRRRLAECP